MGADGTSLFQSYNPDLIEDPEEEARRRYGISRKMEIFFINHIERTDHTVEFSRGIDGGVLVTLKHYPVPVDICRIRPTHDKRHYKKP